MNHGKVKAKIICQHHRSLGPSLIWRHNNTVLPIWDVVGDPAAEKGLHLQTVNWMVKESFKLRRVSIKHHDLVGPSLFDHICHKFSSDGGAETGLLVPLGVREVGGDYGDGLG